MKMTYTSPTANFELFAAKDDACTWISDIFMDGNFGDYGDLSSDTDGDDV